MLPKSKKFQKSYHAKIQDSCNRHLIYYKYINKLNSQINYPLSYILYFDCFQKSRLFKIF